MGISIDEARGLVSVTLTGPVGADEFLTGFQRMIALPGFRPGMKILVDMLAHEHQADSEDVKRIASVLLANGAALRGSEVAVVVARAVSYGMMRMLQVFIESAPFAFSVSYDTGEAKERLGLA